MLALSATIFSLILSCKSPGTFQKFRDFRNKVPELSEQIPGTFQKFRDFRNKVPELSEQSPGTFQKFRDFYSGSQRENPETFGTKSRNFSKVPGLLLWQPRDKFYLNFVMLHMCQSPGTFQKFQRHRTGDPGQATQDR